MYKSIILLAALLLTVGCGPIHVHHYHIVNAGWEPEVTYAPYIDGRYAHFDHFHRSYREACLCKSTGPYPQTFYRVPMGMSHSRHHPQSGTSRRAQRNKR